MYHTTDIKISPESSAYQDHHLSLLLRSQKRIQILQFHPRPPHTQRRRVPPLLPTRAHNPTIRSRARRQAKSRRQSRPLNFHINLAATNIPQDVCCGTVVVGPHGAVRVLAGEEDARRELGALRGCGGEEGADQGCEGGGREGFGCV
jgi:hypothetical protein